MYEINFINKSDTYKRQILTVSNKPKHTHISNSKISNHKILTI